MIALMEAASEERRELLLKSLALEDPGLASLIKLKTLTFDKILKWPEEHLISFLKELSEEEFKSVQVLALAREDWQRRLQTVCDNKGLALSVSAKSAVGRVTAAGVIELQLIGRARELERMGVLPIEDLYSTSRSAA